MWSRRTHAALGRLLRWLAGAPGAGPAAGRFPPLSRGVSGARAGAAARPGRCAVARNVGDAFATVEVDQIAAPNGTPEARIAVELRNDVIWQLTGGAGAGTPAYRLKLTMKASKTAIIVDIATGRTEAEIVGL